jgi:predicted nuclease of predicted toxin-antitoxin system
LAASPHIFLDAQLSPSIAAWTARKFRLRCTHITAIRPRLREDHELVHAAAVPRGIILSKDEDLFHLVHARPSPPDLIWLRCGNRTDAKLKIILLNHLPRALDLIKSGERCVEIRDPDAHTPSRRRR